MLSALLIAATIQIAPDPCAHDRAALLALEPTEFDQTLDGGWRLLSSKPQCLTAAADLLAAYREAHRGDLESGELHSNYWHEGQLRAKLGQRERAVHLLMAGVNPDVAFEGFGDYALGTIAFLNNDLPALQAARDRLAALPEPPDWARYARDIEQRFGLKAKWPKNLDVLDGLIACFGRPYAEAYSACRTPR